MATYATNLTTFWLTGSTTVTAIGTGGAGLGNPETDFFIQGTDCLSKQAWTNATKGFIVDALGTTFTVPTDGGIIMFGKYDAAGSLAAKSAGGLQMIVGSGSGDYDQFYIGGNDTLAYDSWVPYVVDPNTATADATAGSPSGSERWVGILGYLPSTSGPTKGNPIAIDAVRYGRCDLEYTATACTFSGAEAYANDSTRRWGLLELRNGSYLMQGFHSIGTSGASCTFSDSNKVLYFRPSGANNLTNDAVSTGFNRIEILNASTSVTWDNISISALGTRARGVFVHTAGTVTFTGCQFTDMDTFSFLAGATVTDCVWRRCNAVTAPGADLTGGSILAPTVAADTSGLIWDVATDPDGYLDNMTFTKGTNSHHAIEFGTTSPTTMTLRNVTVSGFNASDAATDSVLHIKRTSGTVTIYIVGGSGTFSYKTDGATVDIIPDPVTVKATATTKSGTPIQNARVLLRASDGTGPFPYDETVTISNSGTTATVTHTAHGMASNDYVQITGASLAANNGVFQITYISANSYSYTMGSTPGSSPTGTIKATFVALYGLTDVNGEVSTSRVYSTDQPVTGWARKSTSAPYYQEGVLVGSVDSVDGFDKTAVMVSDE